MNLSGLEKAHPIDIRRWLDDELNLSPWQNERLCDSLRNCPFVIYQNMGRVKTNFLWRMSYPFYILFLLLIIITSPIKWLLTGSSYMSEKTQNFYYGWRSKMGL